MILEGQKGRIHVFHDMEEFEIGSIDDAPFDHLVEINDLAPIGATINDDAEIFGNFMRLHQREQFKEFVERAESARKDTSALAR